MNPMDSSFLVSLETKCKCFNNAAQVFNFFGDKIKIKSISMPGNNENKIFIEFCTAKDYKQAIELISRKNKNDPGLKLNMKKVNILEMLPSNVKEKQVQQQPSKLNNVTWRHSSYDARGIRSQSVSNVRENTFGATRKRTESLSNNLPIHDFNKLSIIHQPTTGRRKLNLLPRTKPLNSDSDDSKITNKRSSIFGNAKPVDTLSRELEIEERIEKEKVEYTRKHDWRNSSHNLYTRISSQPQSNFASVTSTELQKGDISSTIASASSVLSAVKVSEDLKTENDEYNIQKYQEGNDLYKCLMENIGEDVSEGEFHLHHKASRSLVLEIFKEQTEKQGAEFNMKIFESLRNEIETNYESLKKQRQEKSQVNLPNEMLQAIANVVVAFESNMTDDMTDVSTLKVRHTVALRQALDFFDLLTEYMQENNKSNGYKKLLADLAASYEKIQEHQNSILLVECRHKIEIWFKEKLKTINNMDFKKCSELRQIALKKFDENLNDFSHSNSQVVIIHRCYLEKALDRELNNTAIYIAVSSHSVALQKYHITMSTACESSTSETELGQINDQAIKIAMDNYALNTIGLPQNVVMEQQNVLKKSISDEFEIFKIALIEKNVLKRHEKQNQELSRAYMSGLELYMSMTEQPEGCKGDLLHELESRHVSAQDIAIDTFNLMTKNLTPQFTAASRDNLVAELNKRYTKYKKFLTVGILQQLVKIAQAAFSEQMRLAIQVEDMFTRLQVQAQNETLVNFDLATTEFDREVVAEYRAKLEESFEFCLEVVQKLRSSSDFPSAGDTGLCCVCTDNRATVVFQPCLHFNTCDTCAASLTTCAMCRAPIQNKLHVYQ